MILPTPVTALSTILDLAKVWLPVVAIGTFAIRAYIRARNGVEGFFDKLLNNHLEHTQASLDRMETGQKQQTEILGNILEALSKNE
jgi:hypothetical protein